MKTNQLLAWLSGLISALLTTLVFSFIELKTGWSLYSYSLWLVLPVGAVASGFIAGYGYYIGAVKSNYRPNKYTDMCYIVFISVLAFVFINYIEWMFLEVDGQDVNTLVSFIDYLSIIVTNQTFSLVYSKKNSIELGAFGYFTTFLQIIGFAVGGILLHKKLISLPFCDKCQQYLEENYQIIRYYNIPDEASASFSQIITTDFSKFTKDDFTELLSTGSAEFQAGNLISLIFINYKCKYCQLEYVEIKLRKYQKKEWKDIKGLDFSSYLNLDKSNSLHKVPIATQASDNLQQKDYGCKIEHDSTPSSTVTKIEDVMITDTNNRSTDNSKEKEILKIEDKRNSYIYRNWKVAIIIFIPIFAALLNTKKINELIVNYQRNDTITAELREKDYRHFREYAIKIYNCTHGDKFEDIAIPDSLRIKYTNEPLKQFFDQTYSNCWRDYELQTKNYNFSWSSRADEYNNYYILSDVTNVSEYPIEKITLLINEKYTYILSGFSSIEPGSYGRLTCKIPYSLYDEIKTSQSQAQIIGVSYR